MERLLSLSASVFATHTHSTGMVDWRIILRPDGVARNRFLFISPPNRTVVGHAHALIPCNRRGRLAGVDSSRARAANSLRYAKECMRLNLRDIWLSYKTLQKIKKNLLFPVFSATIGKEQEQFTLNGFRKEIPMQGRQAEYQRDKVLGYAGDQITPNEVNHVELPLSQFESKSYCRLSAILPMGSRRLLTAATANLENPSRNLPAGK